MALQFGSHSVASPSPAMGGSVQNGTDLEDIQTEALGFLALSGEAKLQLLPTPWPANQLPLPTSSLMSVASHQGLIAAAGPDVVVVASTESVRKGFESTEGGGNVKAFQPQLRIPMSMRISQLTFSSDEKYLVLSAENGGGLAVYEVQSLLNGSTQSAFELSTNGKALRALIPNPKLSEFFAVVTADGNLMVANIQDRSFVSGPHGQVLKEGVSCMAWSTFGKALVAGLGNGTALQMTPQGEPKVEIPKPPSVSGKDHVSSITWLENNLFLVVHTPSNFGSSQPPNSTFHLITRASSNFVFQKVAEPAGPFGLNRSPPHHFMLRLKDFPPNLQDLIIIASSASGDIGLLSRSKIPLTGEKDAAKITGVFTTTEMSSDSRRAQLPLTADSNDTSPIGLALDLSSKDKVHKPIPGDEIDESPTPLPGLMVLNNEGILASWWIVYSESIRQNTMYPGLVVADAATQSQSQPPAQRHSQALPLGGATNTRPTFGSSTFGTSSAPPAFGARPTNSFGAPSGLGQKTSVWGASSASNTAPSTGGAVFGASTFGSSPASAPAFGASAFGSTNAPAFGSSALAGKQASPWNTSAPTNTGSAFGQTGSLEKPASSFGAPSANTAKSTSSGGFASFADKGGFAAAGAPGSGGSVFSSNSSSNQFGAPSTTSSNGTGSVFGSSINKIENKQANPFGSNNSFVLGSTFRADSSAKEDRAAPPGGPPSSFLGGAFETALGEAANSSPADAAVSKDAEMDSTNDNYGSEEPPELNSTTPAATPAASKSTAFHPSIPATGIVGSPPVASDATLKTPTAGGIFGRQSTPNADETQQLSSNLANKQNPRPESANTEFGKIGTGTTFVAESTTPANNLFGIRSSLSSTGTKPTSSGFNFGQTIPETPEEGALSFANLNTKTTDILKVPAPADAANSIPTSKNPSSPKIKEEEPPSEAPKIDKIPEAPLPPDATSKSSYAAGDTSSSSIGTDAPLPPDFMAKAASKNLLAPPSPPPVRTITVDIIPPMDVPGGPADDEDEDEGFATENEDSDRDDDDGEDISDEASDEGSGEDVVKDLGPASGLDRTPEISPQSSFGLESTTPQRSLFSKISNPLQNQPRSLFGEVGKTAPVLAPPKMQISPRSPSPVRNAIPGRLLGRPDASRSVSAPGIASQLLESQKASKFQAPGQSKTFSATQEEQERAAIRRSEIKARKEAEEEQALVDHDDETMQQFLASEIESTRTLGEFIAHTEYATQTGDSIPAQVETVYRDINSMIDTLGVNARSLKCFIKGHTEQYKEEGRARKDLEEDDDWCLVEIESLSYLLENDLTRDLEDGRVKDIQRKFEVCNDLQRDIMRLRVRHDDIKKIIDTHRGSHHSAVAQNRPLSSEQAAQQLDLRRDFMKFQKLLLEAEEGLSILTTALATQTKGRSRSDGPKRPTVEAIMKTITKMTNMAEKSSGDVDVLEGLMRNIRFNSVSSVGGREGSPFATPQKKRSSMQNSANASSYGLYHTPENVKDNRRDFRSSLVSSSSSHALSSPPRKKLSGYSLEEKAVLKAKSARKKDVTNRLKAALQKSGSNVRVMDDE